MLLLFVVIIASAAGSGSGISGNLAVAVPECVSDANCDCSIGTSRCFFQIKFSKSGVACQ